MIRTKHISKFPLTVFRKNHFAQILCALVRNQSDRSRLTIACALYNAFIDIVGVDFYSAFTITMMWSFRGFLIEETDAKKSEVRKYYNSIVNALPSIFISNIGLEWCDDPGESARCERLYLSLTRDRKKRKYYSGWITISQDGSSHYIDLSKFYSQYGAVETESFHKHLIDYSRKYRSTTLGNKHQAIKKTIDQICETFPTIEEYRLLESPVEVNTFFEYFYELRLASFLIENPDDPDLRSFDKGWHSITNVVVEFFVDKKIIAKPLYDLHRGSYKGAVAADRHNSKPTQKLVRVMTDIPLEINDDEALSRLHAEIVDTFDFFSVVCENARQDTLKRHEHRISSARAGKISKFEDDRDDRRCFENQCATWEKYNYTVISRVERYRFFGTGGGLPDELALLNNSTLLPFVYKIVALEPKITTSWLLNLKLVDKHSQEYGLHSDGTLAISEKARKGPARSQQDIDLSSECRQCFVEILMLTAQARA